jgi:pyruvate kinase
MSDEERGKEKEEDRIICEYEKSCPYEYTCKYEKECKNIKACEYKEECQYIKPKYAGEEEKKPIEICKYRVEKCIETYTDIKTKKTYRLKKWSNKDSRSRVGIICTIGPSVFDPQKGINKISELIKEGMNIARINLSHFRLDENDQPVDLNKMVAIIKTIRRCSDGLRVPVNIMVDLKGPEIRVAFFSVPNLKELVSVTSLEIEEDSQFTIVLSGITGPITVKKPIFALSISKEELTKEFSEGDEYCFSIEGKTDITSECEKKNSDNSFDFKITKVHLREGQSFIFEVQTEIEVFKVNEKNKKIKITKESSKITRIYEPTLRIEKEKKLVLTTDKKRYFNKNDSVIYLDYDGNFGKDIAVHNMSDPIYLDDGKASFKLINIEDRNSPIVEVIYGEKVELRKSMNLFNNTCDSATFISKIDEAYLESILNHEEFKKLCPIDSIAVSFVRQSSDLDRIDTMLQEYGIKEKKNWDIKLVAKIESPHCFMERYIHKKERFNQEKIGYEEYDRILNNRLCWAIMVARGDLGVEIKPAKVPQIQKELTDKANIKGKGVIVATQMLLSMVSNKRPSRADVTDIHNAVLCGADVVMLSEETAKGDYPIEALKCMRNIVNESVDELMKQKNRDIYLKKILEDKESKEANQIMDLLGEPMVNISIKSGSPVIFSYALTGGTATKIPRYRPDKPIIAITYREISARNMLFYFGVFPLLFVGTDKDEKKEDSNKDKEWFDFPRDVKNYREFLKGIIDLAKDSVLSVSVHNPRKIFFYGYPELALSLATVS